MTLYKLTVSLKSKPQFTEPLTSFYFLLLPYYFNLQKKKFCGRCEPNNTNRS